MERHRPSVLVVADDPEFLTAIKEQLAPFVQLVATATAPLHALWLLETVQIDVAICGLRLGSADNAHLLEVVRDRFPEVARILVAGLGDEAVKRETFPAAQAVLQRPYESTQLGALIQAMSPQRDEYRRYPRARIPAKAFVHGADLPARYYDVSNLSAGGALLIGGPRLAAGAVVRLSLHLPEAVPIKLTAKVERHHAADAIGITFLHETPETEDAIHQAILEFLESTG